MSVAEHLQLKLTPSALETAVKGSSKDAMAARGNPENARTVIRFEAQNPTYSAKDMATFRRIVNANLRYDFGYKY